MRFNPESRRKGRRATLFDDGISRFPRSPPPKMRSARRPAPRCASWTLWVFDTDGNKTTVFEYLVSSEKLNSSSRSSAGRSGRRMLSTPANWTRSMSFRAPPVGASSRRKST